MKDISLQNIWKAQDEKLERSLKLNLRIFESMQTQKAQSKLNALVRFKTVAVVIGVLWSAFLGLLIYGNQGKNVYFTVSVGMILFFSIWATAAYIKDIILLKNLDYSSSITNTQKKLAGLQVSTIKSVRIILLQLPFHSTWFWTQKLVTGDTRFQLISFPCTFAFILITIWLYKSISVQNMDKKWVKTFMNIGPEYKSVTRARDFLSEIEEFKKDQDIKA